ncbi:MAG: class I SAM-dependent RNA methyltransferase [Cytophagales bacterium]|nr:class I SAM-dependent RNA methyltransferase [Cytophagales bacterium]
MTDITYSALFEYESPIVVTCAPRNATYLLDEINALKMPIKGTELLNVQTFGTLKDCISLNMHLSTAHRVLFELQAAKAFDLEQVYAVINKIHWEKIIPADGYFSIDSVTDSTEVRDSRFLNLKIKDAIADRFINILNRRPDSGPDDSKTVLFIYWKNHDLKIYLDTSGVSIAKHGYRTSPYKAPLQEALAHCIIKATDWDMNSTLILPMCGSGTLAIEAALLAMQKPPGLFSENFAFMHILGYDNIWWQDLKKEVLRKINYKINARIIASDIDPNAIKYAKINARNAGVNALIYFQTCDIADTQVPASNNGIVIINPPYGERMGDEDAELSDLYQKIGNFLKQKCAGYTAYVFTGNVEMAKKIGLKATRRIEFYNGKIDCRLLKYEMYSGTKRIFENTSE